MSMYKLYLCFSLSTPIRKNSKVRLSGLFTYYEYENYILLFFFFNVRAMKLKNKAFISKQSLLSYFLFSN